MKKLIFIVAMLCLLVLSVNSSAQLGTYVADDNVTFSIVCHNDEGRVDKGCTSGNATLYAPNGSNMAFRPMTESAAPGLWFGDFQVNRSGAQIGTWSIYIRVINSNSTDGGTVLQFQVVQSDSGFNNISDALADVLLDTSGISGLATSENLSAINDSIGANFSNIMAQGNAAWITAGLDDLGGVCTSGNLSANITDIKLNLTQILLNQSRLMLRGDEAWTTAEVSGLATSENLTNINQTLFTKMQDINATNMRNITTITNAIIAGQAVISDDINTSLSIDGLATSANLSSINDTLFLRMNDINASIQTKIDLTNASQLKNISIAMTALIAGQYVISTDLNNTAQYQTDLGGMCTSANLTSVNLTLFTKMQDINASNMRNLTTDLPILIDARLNSSHGPGSWKTAGSTTAVISFDLSKSGILNATFFNGEVVHVIGDIDPENSESMKDNYYIKAIFDIGALPDNMTNAWVIYWAKKSGNPTGDLNISVFGNTINTTDVSTYTASITKFIIPFGPGNLTDGYIEILFNGSASWTGGNCIDGYDYICVIVN